MTSIDLDGTGTLNIERAANGDIIIRHDPSGDTVTIDESGLTAPAVQAEDLVTESRGPSVTVHVKDDGTVVANGPNSQLASGDINTQSDVRTVLQSAIDEGGHVTVKKHSSDYVVDVAGQDAESVDYCLQMQPNTTLEIERGATIRYPADSSVTPPQVATPIVCTGISNYKICGKGTIDAGYHRTPQDHTDDISAYVIKMGVKNKPNNGDVSGTDVHNAVIRDITITGGYRHGLETANKSSRVLVENVISDDGAGDDDFGIGGPVNYVTYRNCWSINHTRIGTWTSAGFEMDDGPRDCYFINCHTIDPTVGVDGVDGFVLGKSHGWNTSASNEGRASERIYAINCNAHKCRWGFSVVPSGVNDKDIRIIDPNVFDCEEGVYTVAKDPGSLSRLTISGGTIRNSTNNGVYVRNEGDCDIVKINDVDILDCGNRGILLIAKYANGPLDGVTIDGVTAINNSEIQIEIRDQDNDVADLTIRNCKLKDGGDHSIALTANSTAGNYIDPRIENNRILNSAFRGITIGGDATFSGRGIIKGNVFRNNGGISIAFPDTTQRQVVKTVENDGYDDYSPEVLSSPEAGEEYLDDGTNTGSGTRGKRVYDGAAWNDAWTL